MTTAQLGDPLKNTFTEGVADRLKSLIMDPRLSPKWHWDLQALLYRPLVNGNPLKIKGLLSRLEEALQEKLREEIR